MARIRSALAVLGIATGTLMVTVGTHAADPAPAPPTCESAEYRQFDFWLGDWAVTADGERAGTNRIEAMLGRCALLESWTGAGKSRGHSLNFYDRADRHWHQTWIDNSGGALYLSGGIENGSMVLSGRRPPRADGEQNVETLHRITWTPLADGRVRQHWEASRDDGKSWETLFDGYYAQRAE
jgi:hypothetical protein